MRTSRSSVISRTAYAGPSFVFPEDLTPPYGMLSAAHQFVMKINRYMHDHGVGQEALRAISLASYVALLQWFTARVSSSCGDPSPFAGNMVFSKW